jgi:ABC-type branched-subunit amino acid transport system ATPase component/ABC-type branched-subunit amino acid transport system permease subunit
MLGSVFTANLLFAGAVDGLIIAMLGIGIVLVYRSSRVINFAVGDLGVPSAALLAITAVRDHWPYWLALVAVLLVGTLAGAVVELAVIRRLFRAPRVIVLVATIGVAELAQAVTGALPGFRGSETPPTFPSPITSHWDLGSVRVEGSQLLALIVVPAVSVAVWWLLNRTRFGDAVRACATNADLARLTGVNPKLVSTAIWSIAGFLSSIAVILWATAQHSSNLVTIGPDTLLLGLAAALVGRMTSFPKTALGAVALGIAGRLISFNFSNDSGLGQFVFFVVVLVLVARMSRNDDTGGESFAFAPRVRPVPERLREIWWVRRMQYLIGGGALAIAIVVPLLITRSGHQFTYATILAFAICAVSVTVLTGWGGQLSLSQMAFAGVGALGAAAFQRGASVDIGWRSTRILNGSLPTMPFAVAVLLGACVACLFAVAVGLGALRVKGLLLAISSLAFAIAAQDYIFHRPMFAVTPYDTTVELNRGHLGPIDLADRNRAYYYLVLAALVVSVLAMARLRRTGIGRMIIGVRENEHAASALTVSPVRAKLIAFASGGFIAGFGGALLGGLVVDIAFTDRFFRVQDSLAIVSMAVIGGLGSLAGAIVGALWVVGLPSFWPTNTTVPLFTSSIGLLIILLYMPGGFTQIGYWLRAQVLRWLEPRLAERPAKTVTAPPESLRRIAERHSITTNDDGSVLTTGALTVTFGGLVAVDAVEFRAMPGEVVGLIGTNGAGKSTLLNAMGGYVPSTGSVRLLGREVSRLPAHARARVGLGRTFQAATLFPELTVRETVQLALEAREPTSFWGTLCFVPRSTRSERAKRTEAAELIDFLGLGRYADRFIAELSTGTRRIVELASVLAVAPRVICLDEPTAGVAQREAEAFGPLIKRVQQELDATLVIVEHDLPLIVSISDRLCCMEAGAVIAEGTPEHVRSHPRVIASYLGTDERAIERSDVAT